MLRMSDKLNFIMKSAYLNFLFRLKRRTAIFLLFTIANVGLIFIDPKK